MASYAEEDLISPGAKALLNEFIECKQQLDAILEADPRISELTRRIRSLKTRIGLEEARANGKKLGRPREYPPFLRARILRMHDAGMSLRTIAFSVGGNRSSVQRIISRRGKEDSCQTIPIEELKWLIREVRRLSTEGPGLRL